MNAKLAAKTRKAIEGHYERMRTASKKELDVLLVDTFTSFLKGRRWVDGTTLSFLDAMGSVTVDLQRPGRRDYRITSYDYSCDGMDWLNWVGRFRGRDYGAEFFGSLYAVLDLYTTLSDLTKTASEVKVRIRGGIVEVLE